MKKLHLQTLLAFLVVMVMLVPVFTFAQELLIPAPTSADDYLNDRIAEDSTATGERNDPDRIYVLERDAVYFVNDDLRNTDWTLRIKAQDGAGKKPVIYLVTDTETNAFPGQFLDMRGDVYLKDFVLVGYLEPLEGEIANIPSGLIRTNAAGFDLVIDGCIISNTRGQHIRTQSATRVTKITNSIFANMGDLGRSNFGAGKGIDLRDGSCDSLIMINNTFVNFQDRIIRHRSSTASLEHLVFDHNTIVNGMSYHGTLALGWTGADAVITNNLFIDNFIAGNDTDAVRQSEFDESGETDAYGYARMSWIGSVPNDETEWTISGNYYSVSPEVQAFYDAHAAAGVTGEGDPLTENIAAKLGAGAASAFTKEMIEVVDRPAPMVAMAEWYRSPAGGNKTKSTTNFNRATDDFDRKPVTYFKDTLNCAYSTDLGAYSGADGGFPAGDLNWFPGKKSEWEDYITVIEWQEPAQPSEFLLHQNYPNPFNPSTRISFNLPHSGFTTLNIYNVLGQVVATPINSHLVAGSHDVNFDASMLPNGIYFYQLQAGNQIQMKKMMLLK